MNLLALDTSSLACSVALQVDDTVVERYEEQPREHTRLLMPMIEGVLTEAGTALTELDAIVLGNGPGSFIGMRIAASVAQGLGYASGLAIVPVSSMAAIAARVLSEHEISEVVVAQDAHMHEVYLGIYRRDEVGNPANVIDESLHGLSTIEVLDPAQVSERIAAGYGWQRYPELLVANRDRITRSAEALYPRARDLLRLGELGEAVEPRDVVPAYLRQKVAEKPTAVS